MLHRDGFGVADPTANILQWIFGQQFCLTTGSQVVKQFRPGFDACLLQQLVERGPMFWLLDRQRVMTGVLIGQSIPGFARSYNS